MNYLISFLQSITSSLSFYFSCKFNIDLKKKQTNKKASLTKQIDNLIKRLTKENILLRLKIYSLIVFLFTLGISFLIEVIGNYCLSDNVLDSAQEATIKIKQNLNDSTEVKERQKMAELNDCGSILNNIEGDVDKYFLYLEINQNQKVEIEKAIVTIIKSYKQ